MQAQWNPKLLSLFCSFLLHALDCSLRKIQIQMKIGNSFRINFRSCVIAPLHVVFFAYHHNAETEFDGESIIFVTQIQTQICLLCESIPSLFLMPLLLALYRAGVWKVGRAPFLPVPALNWSRWHGCQAFPLITLRSCRPFTGVSRPSGLKTAKKTQRKKSWAFRAGVLKKP